MERKDKIEKLKNAKKVLKTEFFGLDGVIDRIITAITPWYVTPEIITRPVIISLWGMTGTGKTSVVNRLLELLEIKKSISVDCGEKLEEEKSLISRIFSLLGIDEDNLDYDSSIQGTVFIFDEFQYAKTLDEESKMLDKPNIRAIWSLIDDGKLNVGYQFNYEFNRLMNFIDDFTSSPDLISNIKIKNGFIENPADVKMFLDEMGYWYDRVTPDYTDRFSSANNDKNDVYRPLLVINNELRRAMQRRLNGLKERSGNEWFNEFNSTTLTVGELSAKLKDAKNKLISPKTLDCTNSLVFVIGNLDEVFTGSKNMSPDIDADTFHDMTEHITISDIKDALTLKFKPEQISRLGNNIIKYPTLKKENFKKIIDKEINNIISSFCEKVDKSLDIEVTDSVKKMLYSEGIFPSQGVRPVFTTIGSMLMPYLSNILIEKTEKDRKIIIDIFGKPKFNATEATVWIKFPDTGKDLKILHKLYLGESRCPEKRKTRFINSVHEAGHAIVFAKLHGIPPIEIISVSADHGGVCITYDKDRESEISTKRDVDVSVSVSLAGALAEKVIYPRPGMRLLGSSVDLFMAWKTLSKEAIGGGYFNLCDYSNRYGDGPCPLGLGLNSTVIYKNTEMTVDEALKIRFKEIENSTYEFLKSEVTLIKKVALYLGEHGKMSGEIFMDFVRQYGVRLNEEGMKKIKMNFGYDYYRKVLE